uniref:Nucleoside-diphosphate kinase n=1 Tax=Steinernema glaseri TaxID=37863 RepID=A0A1I7YUD8_9BILA
MSGDNIARCIAFLKPAGDEAKIRACLEAEQAE